MPTKFAPWPQIAFDNRQSNIMLAIIIWLTISVQALHSTPVVAGKSSLQRAITFTEPTEPLEFRENVRKRPKRKNLKKSRLLRKMGLDFKTDWMSIEEPINSESSTIEMSEDQVAKLVEQVDELKLGEELQELSGLKDGLDKQAIAVFQQWLVRKSSCPVNFEWTDLGEYFWPRWIRQGSCERGKKRYSSQNEGCSWPQGMRCVQGNIEMLQILRWHCRTRHNRSKNTKSSKRKCKWYKVPYPVTSSCKCSCKEA